MWQVLVVALGLGLAAPLAGSPAVGGQPATAITEPEPDLAANKRLVARYFEIAGAGDLATIGEVVGDDFVILTAPPGEGSTVESLTQTLAAARAGLPDFAFRIDDLIAEGDLVVSRTTISGTHLGDFFGAPPTGKRIETTAIDVWRIDGGKLSENWHFEDILGVMRQLGAIPGDPGTPVAASTGVTAAPTTPTDAAMAANTDLARRFREDLLASGDLAAADELLAPGVVWHNAARPGVEGVKGAVDGLRAAFPDLALEIDQIVAEGDRVAVVWTLTGTHQGDFLGVPATGVRVVTSGSDIYRIESGRIAEIWTVGDDLGVLFQLGAFPPTNGG